MAKQEKIRRGLIGILAISNISVEAKLKFVLGFLYENNVVIEVDRVLPDVGLELLNQLYKFGSYVAVEPLVVHNK